MGENSLNAMLLEKAMMAPTHHPAAPNGVSEVRMP